MVRIGIKGVVGLYSFLLPLNLINFRFSSSQEKRLINSEEKSLFSHKRDDIALVGPPATSEHFMRRLPSVT